MSSKQRRYPTKNLGISKGYAVASSNSSNYQRESNPFGPGMAESVFNVYDDDLDECVSDYSEKCYDAEVDQEDMYDGVLQSFHFRYQEDLDLETNAEREERLKRSIRRFESAYRKMSLYALKWAYLEEEVEDDEQVRKMFKDMQMIRKLRGSDAV